MTGESELRAALLQLVAHEDQPCVIDHHGDCQEHSCTGGPCSVAHARQLLGLPNSLDAEEPQCEHRFWDVVAICTVCGEGFEPTGYQIHERLAGEQALTAEVFEVVRLAIHRASRQCMFDSDECLDEGTCVREARAVVEALHEHINPQRGSKQP
jgi:hypothetical protein